MCYSLQLWPLTALFVSVKEHKGCSGDYRGRSSTDLKRGLLRRYGEILKGNGVEHFYVFKDSLIALSGIPIPDDSTANILVASSISMLLELKSTSEWQHLRLRIGLHSDKVIAGMVDSYRLPYDVYGLAVHTAERIHRIGKIDHITVSDQTAALISDSYQSTYWRRVDSMGEIHRPLKDSITKAIENPPVFEDGDIGIFTVSIPENTK